MRALYRQLVPPSAVHNAVYGSFVRVDAVDIAVTCGNMLQIYALTTTRDEGLAARLVRKASWSAYESIADIAPGPVVDVYGLQSLVVAFANAKVSIIVFDPPTQSLRTISMHQYDCPSPPWEMAFGLQLDTKHLRDGSDGGTKYSYMKPMLACDNARKLYACLCLRRTLMLVPMSDKNKKISSYALDLSKEFGIMHPISIVFLFGYMDPTLAILHRQVDRTDPSERPRTAITVISIDVTSRKHPVVWNILDLPHHAFRMLPLRDPSGSLLLLTHNSIIALHQQRGTVLPVNAMAAVDFIDSNPHVTMHFLPLFGGKFSRMYAKKVPEQTSESTTIPQELVHDQCVAEPMLLDGTVVTMTNFSPRALLLATASGDLHLLLLSVSGVSVDDMVLRRIGTVPPPSVLLAVPSDFLLVGSLVTDAILYYTPVAYVTKKTKEIEAYGEDRADLVDVSGGRKRARDAGREDLEHSRTSRAEAMDALALLSKHSIYNDDEAQLWRVFDSTGPERTMTTFRAQMFGGDDRDDIDAEFSFIFGIDKFGASDVFHRHSLSRADAVEIQLTLEIHDTLTTLAPARHLTIQNVLEHSNKKTLDLVLTSGVGPSGSVSILTRTVRMTTLDIPSLSFIDGNVMDGIERYSPVTMEMLDHHHVDTVEYVLSSSPSPSSIAVLQYNSDGKVSGISIDIEGFGSYICGGRVGRNPIVLSASVRPDQYTPVDAVVCVGSESIIVLEGSTVKSISKLTMSIIMARVYDPFIVMIGSDHNLYVVMVTSDGTACTISEQIKYQHSHLVQSVCLVDSRVLPFDINNIHDHSASEFKRWTDGKYVINTGDGGDGTGIAVYMWIVYDDGDIEAVRLPTLSVVFRSPGVSNGSGVLLNSLISSISQISMAPNVPHIDDMMMTSLSLSSSSQDAYLVLSCSSGQVLVYKCYSHGNGNDVLAIRFARVELFSNLCDVFYGVGAKRQVCSRRFYSIGPDRIVITGRQPAMMYLEHGMFEISKFGDKDELKSIAPLSSSSSNTYVVSTSKNNVKLVCLNAPTPHYNSYLSKFPINHTVHVVTAHPPSGCFVVVVSYFVKWNVTYKTKEAAESEEPVNLSRAPKEQAADKQEIPTVIEEATAVDAVIEEGECIPPNFEKRYELQLYDSSWNILDRFPFPRRERVQDARYVSLYTDNAARRALNERDPPRRGFIAAGTCVVGDEDLQSTGRILLFEIVLPRTLESTETAYKIKLTVDKESRGLFTNEAKGPVTAICELDGLLLTSMGRKAILYEFFNNDLYHCGFVELAHYITHLVAMHQYLLCSDQVKGIQFVRWKDKKRQMQILGKEVNPSLTSRVISCDFICCKDSLGLVCADQSSSLSLFEYEVLSLEKKAGQILTCTSELRLPCPVACITRFKLFNKITNGYDIVDAPASLTSGKYDEIPDVGCLLSTRDGGIDALVPLREETYAILLILHEKLSRILPHVAGINPDGASYANHEIKTIKTESNAILDGRVVYRFPSLDYTLQHAIASSMDLTPGDILRTLGELDERINMF